MELRCQTTTSWPGLSVARRLVALALCFLSPWGPSVAARTDHLNGAGPLPSRSGAALGGFSSQRHLGTDRTGGPVSRTRFPQGPAAFRSGASPGGEHISARSGFRSEFGAGETELWEREPNLGERPVASRGAAIRQTGAFNRPAASGSTGNAGFPSGDIVAGLEAETGHRYLSARRPTRPGTADPAGSVYVETVTVVNNTLVLSSDFYGRQSRDPAPKHGQPPPSWSVSYHVENSLLRERGASNPYHWGFSLAVDFQTGRNYRLETSQGFIWTQQGAFTPSSITTQSGEDDTHLVAATPRLTLTAEAVPSHYRKNSLSAQHPAGRRWSETETTGSRVVQSETEPPPAGSSVVPMSSLPEYLDGKSQGSSRETTPGATQKERVKSNIYNYGPSSLSGGSESRETSPRATMGRSVTSDPSEVPISREEEAKMVPTAAVPDIWRSNSDEAQKPRKSTVRYHVSKGSERGEGKWSPDEDVGRIREESGLFADLTLLVFSAARPVSMETGKNLPGVVSVMAASSEIGVQGNRGHQVIPSQQQSLGRKNTGTRKPQRLTRPADEKATGGDSDPVFPTSYETSSMLVRRGASETMLFETLGSPDGGYEEGSFKNLAGETNRPALETSFELFAYDVEGRAVTLGVTASDSRVTSSATNGLNVGNVEDMMPTARIPSVSRVETLVDGRMREKGQSNMLPEMMILLEMEGTGSTSDGGLPLKSPWNYSPTESSTGTKSKPVREEGFRTARTNSRNLTLSAAENSSPPVPTTGRAECSVPEGGTVSLSARSERVEPTPSPKKVVEGETHQGHMALKTAPPDMSATSMSADVVRSSVLVPIPGVWADDYSGDADHPPNEAVGRSVIRWGNSRAANQLENCFLRIVFRAPAVGVRSEGFRRQIKAGLRKSYKEGLSRVSRWKGKSLEPPSVVTVTLGETIGLPGRSRTGQEFYVSVNNAPVPAEVAAGIFRRLTAEETSECLHVQVVEAVTMVMHNHGQKRPVDSTKTTPGVGSDSANSSAGDNISDDVERPPVRASFLSTASDSHISSSTQSVSIQKSCTDSDISETATASTSSLTLVTEPDDGDFISSGSFQTDNPLKVDLSRRNGVFPDTDGGTKTGNSKDLPDMSKDETLPSRSDASSLFQTDEAPHAEASGSLPFSNVNQPANGTQEDGHKPKADDGNLASSLLFVDGLSSVSRYRATSGGFEKREYKSAEVFQDVETRSSSPVRKARVWDATKDNVVFLSTFSTAHPIPVTRRSPDRGRQSGSGSTPVHQPNTVSEFSSSEDGLSITSRPAPPYFDPDSGTLANFPGLSGRPFESTRDTPTRQYSFETSGFSKSSSAYRDAEAAIGSTKTGAKSHRDSIAQYAEVSPETTPEIDTALTNADGPLESSLTTVFEDNDSLLDTGEKYAQVTELTGSVMLGTRMLRATPSWPEYITPGRSVDHTNQVTVEKQFDYSSLPLLLVLLKTPVSFPPPSVPRRQSTAFATDSNRRGQSLFLEGQTISESRDQMRAVRFLGSTGTNSTDIATNVQLLSDSMSTSAYSNSNAKTAYVSAPQSNLGNAEHSAGFLYPSASLISPAELFPGSESFQSDIIFSSSLMSKGGIPKPQRQESSLLQPSAAQLSGTPSGLGRLTTQSPVAEGTDFPDGGQRQSVGDKVPSLQTTINTEDQTEITARSSQSAVPPFPSTARSSHTAPVIPGGTKKFHVPTTGLSSVSSAGPEFSLSRELASVPGGETEASGSATTMRTPPSRSSPPEGGSETGARGFPSPSAGSSQPVLTVSRVEARPEAGSDSSLGAPAVHSSPLASRETAKSSRPLDGPSPTSTTSFENAGPSGENGEISPAPPGSSPASPDPSDVPHSPGLRRTTGTLQGMVSEKTPALPPSKTVGEAISGRASFLDNRSSPSLTDRQSSAASETVTQPGDSEGFSKKSLRDTEGWGEYTTPDPFTTLAASQKRMTASSVTMGLPSTSPLPPNSRLKESTISQTSVVELVSFSSSSPHSILKSKTMTSSAMVVMKSSTATDQYKTKSVLALLSSSALLVTPTGLFPSMSEIQSQSGLELSSQSVSSTLRFVPSSHVAESPAVFPTNRHSGTSVVATSQQTTVSPGFNQILVVRFIVEDEVDLHSPNFVVQIETGLAEIYREVTSPSGTSKKRRRTTEVTLLGKARSEIVLSHKSKIEAEIIDVHSNYLKKVVDINFYMMENKQIVPAEVAERAFSEMELREMSRILKRQVTEPIKALEHVLGEAPSPAPMTQWMAIAIGLPSIVVVLSVAVLATVWYRNDFRSTRRAVSASLYSGSQCAESLADYNLEVDVERGEIVSRGCPTLSTDDLTTETLDRATDQELDRERHSMVSNSWKSLNELESFIFQSYKKPRLKKAKERKKRQQRKRQKKKHFYFGYDYDSSGKSEKVPLTETFRKSLNSYRSTSCTQFHEANQQNNAIRCRPLLHAAIISEFLSEDDSQGTEDTNIGSESSLAYDCLNTSGSSS